MNKYSKPIIYSVLRYKTEYENKSIDSVAGIEDLLE